jgi:eukaryotic-like serine/threonine-protein kinase
MKFVTLFLQIKSFILSKYFIKHIGLVILFYLFFIFAAIIYLNLVTSHGEKIIVPNLVGLSSEEAKSKIEALGLQYEILDSIYDPKSPLFSKPSGTVYEQLVEPTITSLIFVKSNRVIGLRLTKKSDLVEMPSLIHKQIQFAQSILEGRGLRFRIQYRPSNEENGSVIEQLYKGNRVKDGARISIGSVITLIVGQNDLGDPVYTPNLVGLFRDEALYILDTLGIMSYNVICPDCFTREDSTSAVIFSQTPEYIEGATVLKSTQFTITMQKYIEIE